MKSRLYDLVLPLVKFLRLYLISSQVKIAFQYQPLRLNLKFGFEFRIHRYLIHFGLLNLHLLTNSNIKPDKICLTIGKISLGKLRDLLV